MATQEGIEWVGENRDAAQKWAGVGGNVTEEELRTLFVSEPTPSPANDADTGPDIAPFVLVTAAPFQVFIHSNKIKSLQHLRAQDIVIISYHTTMGPRRKTKQHLQQGGRSNSETATLAVEFDEGPVSLLDESGLQEEMNTVKRLSHYYCHKQATNVANRANQTM
ncbi:MAG: hypothetical protein M1839_002093 [Geoglossum umbratile]|nr:MAG: hypothetical protein M1839_002093 [Geoglossum umbratile]